MPGKLLFNIKKDRRCSKQAMGGEIPIKCSQNEMRKTEIKTEGFPKVGCFKQCNRAGC